MNKKWIFFLSVKKITTKIVFDGRFAPEHSDLIVMKPNFVIAAAFALSILLLSACKSTTVEVPASMALRNGAVNDPSAVTVKVSLGNRAVYVIENGETKFAAAIAIGTASNPTPVGNFKVQSKEAKKRSSGYGFFVKGDQVIPGKRSNMPSGYRDVGYPLPYWVYFSHDCGFHGGAVWPEPRTHGCLRLHKTIAADFYNMVKVGTPVLVANSQPEDASVGRNIPRPTDFDHPDSPPSVLITDAPFTRTDVYY